MIERQTVVAHLHALNKRIEESKAFFLDLIEPICAEPGVIEYWLQPDNDDPTEFTH